MATVDRLGRVVVFLVALVVLGHSVHLAFWADRRMPMALAGLTLGCALLAIIIAAVEVLRGRRGN